MAVDLALRVALRGCLALVVVLLALAHAQLDLHARVLEIDRERDEGVAVLLDERMELVDLTLVQQQPLGAVGVVVEDVALVVGRDVHGVDHGLAVFHNAVAVLEVERSRADGLDLRPLQLDTGLETVLHKVVVIGLAVLRRDLDSLFLHGTVPPSPSQRISVYHDSARRTRAVIKM